MVKPLSQSTCEQAKTYYYDYICEGNSGHIPDEVMTHIEGCRHCQALAEKLKFELFKSEVDVGRDVDKDDSALVDSLKLHFAYVDKPVSCDVAKPFLPALLTEAFKIRIPTPIMAHIFDCQKCSEDLDAIRSMKLGRKQLYRLGRLFADKSAGSDVDCAEARKAIPAVVSMAFSETNSKILKHLCTCSACRKLVYRERQKLCVAAENNSSTEFPCESVSSSDLFDYVVPYGIDPANDQYARFRESLTSHLVACRNCLTEMQKLHDTVYSITERPESDVVTMYRIDESAKVEVPDDSDDVYAGFPVRVERLNPDRFRTGSVLKRKVLTANFKPFIKTGIAAAVILAVGIFFFHTTTAGAVTIDRIYKAISDIKNVYIAKFTPDSAEPQQELWVSKTLQFYMTKFEDRAILWDARNGVKKTKGLSTGTAETSSLTRDVVVGIDRKISGHLGLVPFTNVSEVPAGAIWKKAPIEQVTGLSSGAVADGLEVYDLLWTAKVSDGSDILKKWRVFVDPKTNLPQRTEFYEKLPIDSELLLQSVSVVKYLDGSEIQAVIKELSF
jgi:hypothetical protein